MAAQGVPASVGAAGGLGGCVRIRFALTLSRGFIVTISDKYEAIKRFVEAEGAYVQAIAMVERLGGGTHPIYGNDESAELAAFAFTSARRFLRSNPPIEGETEDAYLGRFASAMEPEWSLWRFDRIRNAWTREDFELGEKRYDVHGLMQAREWGLSLPAERKAALSAALNEAAHGDGAVARELERIAEDCASRDLGLVWFDLRRSIRFVDSQLGRFYRENQDNGGAWSPPPEYDEWKAVIRAGEAAKPILASLIAELSGGRYPE